MTFLTDGMGEGTSNLLDTLIYHERRYLASKENLDREKRSVEHHKSEYVRARSALIKKGVSLSRGLFDV